MEISDEDKKKLIAILEEKWDDVSCNMCGSDLKISETLFGLREFDKSGISYVIPLIPLTCIECGNTILINPGELGLLK